MVVVDPRRTFCGGGTSSPQIGVAPVITLTAAGIDAFLSPIIDPVAATVIAGILAASLEIDVATYCAGDPPADPNIQPGDVADAINFTDTVNQAIAVQKLGTWFLSQYWYRICKCDSGSQPTPPTPTNPGPVSQNPGIPGANAPTQCWNITVPFSVPAKNTVTSLPGIADLASVALPPGVTFTGPNGVAVAIPSAVSNMRLGMTVDQSVGTQLLQTEWVMEDASGNVHGSGLLAEWATTGLNQSASNLNLASVPSGALNWGLFVSNSNTVPYTGTVTTSMSCGPGSNLTQRACCPPDTTSQQMLLQIIGILNSTRNSITTVQTDITNLQTDVTAIDTNLTTVQTDVTNLTSVTNTLAVDVTNLQTDVTNLQTTIDSETNTTITNVNTTVTATDTTVNTINTTVNEISAELTLNSETVNNLQAYQTPFGYTLGTSHTGLTGDGSFGVSSLSGIFIELTTVPPSLGFDLGEPTYYFDAGWASVLDSNGFIDETRIHAINQVWQPRLMSEATVIGYSLKQGTVATIREILPKVGP